MTWVSYVIYNCFDLTHGCDPLYFSKCSVIFRLVFLFFIWLLSFLFSAVFHIACACRFLYGPETKEEHKAQIDKSLDGKAELKLELILYKKNGMYALCVCVFLWYFFYFSVVVSFRFYSSCPIDWISCMHIACTIYRYFPLHAKLVWQIQSPLTCHKILDHFFSYISIVYCHSEGFFLC